MSRLAEARDIVIEPIELESVLYTACPSECDACGERAVRAIATAVARGEAGDIELADEAARAAAAELMAAACFVKAVAAAVFAFSLREARTPSAFEAVREALKGSATAVPAAQTLARAFLEQRAVC